MRTLAVHFALLALLCTAVTGQRLVVESDTVEGQLLQAIDSEQDAAKRLPLLEKFAKEFPNHEAVTWVLSHLQADAFARQDYDRVLTLAMRIMTLDPDDIAAAHNALRAVEARKDVDLIKRWSTQTSIIAKRVIKSREPDDPEELADWKARVEFAKQVDTYTEYSLYFAALNAKETRMKSDLIEALEQRNPKSEYLAQMRTSQASVFRQVDAEEAVRSAEQSFANGEFNVDQLFMMATYYMQKRTAPEKVVLYGAKLLELLEQTGKPAEVSEEDWGKRRSQVVGQTNWMVGLIYSTQEKFALADKHLRASLVDVKDKEMIAGALYHLGYANYRIAESGERIRIHDAVKFTSDCAKIPSAVQLQAAENLKSMRAEYALPAQEEEE